MARWVENGKADARRTRFALRAAWAALDATEHDRFIRWLAWLCVAAASHGDATLAARLRHLDADWAVAIARAMRKLPGHPHAAKPLHALRLSA